jgi:hypothetical protein
MSIDTRSVDELRSVDALRPYALRDHQHFQLFQWFFGVTLFLILNTRVSSSLSMCVLKLILFYFSIESIESIEGPANPWVCSVNTFCGYPHLSIDAPRYSVISMGVYRCLAALSSSLQTRSICSSTPDPAPNPLARRLQRRTSGDHTFPMHVARSCPRPVRTALLSSVSPSVRGRTAIAVATWTQCLTLARLCPFSRRTVDQGSQKMWAGLCRQPSTEDLAPGPRP